MAVSVRLDPHTERALETLARRGGKTKSALLREAILRLEKESAAAKTETSFEVMTRLGLLGCIEGDGKDLSTDSGRKVRTILLDKQRRRRARDAR